MKRIGFACKWIDRPDQVEGIDKKDECKALNTGSTTVAWLNRQTTEVAEQKLWDLMVGNIEATRKLVPMSEPIAKEHLEPWEIWLARGVLGCLCILVSLLCWQVSTLVL
jgi:hypothetical protein